VISGCFYSEKYHMSDATCISKQKLVRGSQDRWTCRKAEQILAIKMTFNQAVTPTLKCSRIYTKILCDLVGK
jgi:hypothetical protein